MKNNCQNLSVLVQFFFSFTCINICVSIQEPASSTLAPDASAMSAPYLSRSNISNIMTPHSSMSMRQSILTPASETEEDIEQLSAMKVYYSQKLESAIVSTDIICYVIRNQQAALQAPGASA